MVEVLVEPGICKYDEQKAVAALCWCADVTREVTVLQNGLFALMSNFSAPALRLTALRMDKRMESHISNSGSRVSKLRISRTGQRRYDIL